MDRCTEDTTHTSNSRTICQRSGTAIMAVGISTFEGGRNSKGILLYVRSASKDSINFVLATHIEG